MSGVYLCERDDITPGEPLLVEAGDLEVAVMRVGDDVYVIDDQCSHGPGSLSEGDLDGYTIICDFHEGGFDIRTGEPVLPPCMEPVRSYPVEIVDGAVHIHPDRAGGGCPAA